MQAIHTTSTPEAKHGAELPSCRAQRIIHGTALEHALSPPGSAEKLAATAAAAVLAPVHQLAAGQGARLCAPPTPMLWPRCHLGAKRARDTVCC